MRSILVILCALSLAACAAHQPAPEDSGQTAGDFRQQLRAALLDEPELVLDLLDEHDIEAYDIVTRGAEHKRQREQAEQLAHELENPLAPVIDPARPMRGDVDAPVTIVSYSDYLCSWCARGSQTMAALLDKWAGKVRVLCKHNPRSEQSGTAALYYEALGEQSPELAFALHDRIFADQQPLADGGEDYVKGLAEELGADMDRLAADLERDDLKARIAADIEEAEEFGFSGTPMYVVGGVSVRGAKPMDEFDQVIDLVLERETAK